LIYAAHYGGGGFVGVTELPAPSVAVGGITVGMTGAEDDPLDNPESGIAEVGDPVGELEEASAGVGAGICGVFDLTVQYWSVGGVKD
jgi:hypothetical protein